MRQFVLRVLMVIGLTSGLAFATVPGAAQAETAGQFGSTATLIASGVGINVPVTYICPPDGSVASLEVSVTQAVRGVLVRGSGSTSPLTCDDTQHTVVTSVFASAVTVTMLPIGIWPLGCTDTTVPDACCALRTHTTRGCRPSSRSCWRTTATG